MNLIILHGRLTADPELRTTQSGVECCNFTVAVNRPTAQGKPPEADFIPCTAWRQSAVFLSKYFHKGDGIIVEGSLESRKYTDKDGQERKMYSAQVRRLEFAEKTSKASEQTPPANQDFQPVADTDELPF